MQDRFAPLRAEVAWDGVVAVVAVSGELDITTAPRLIERLGEVADGRPERLVLDLAGIVFLDVPGVRALDSAHKIMEAICPVTVRNARPAARRVDEITGPRATPPSEPGPPGRTALCWGCG